MKRLFFLLFLMCGAVCKMQAQLDAQLRQYNAALNYYNPAAAGLSGKLDVMGLYRVQWGFEGSPKSVFAMANMPFSFMGKEHGVGVTFLRNDASTVFSMLNTGAQYAYLKKIGKGTLRVGLQLGFTELTINGENIILPVDSLGNPGGTDQAIPTSKVSSRVFDANIGIYYSTEKWYFGAASMHLLEPEINEENTAYFFERTYNLTGGYNIQTNNPLIELRPSVMVKTNLNTYQAELTAIAVLAKRFSGGLSWRMNESLFTDGNVLMNDAIVLLLGARFGKIQGGYAYDIPTSAAGRGGLGSHELFIKYQLQVNKPKTGKSKHKSVRIL